MKGLRPYQLDVEIGPGGWVCPAWYENGLRCALYRGVVHQWDPKTLLFGETQRRPPWELDVRELAVEGFDG